MACARDAAINKTVNYSTRLLINKNVKGGTKCLLALLLVGTQLAAVGVLAFMFYDCSQDVQLAYIQAGDDPGAFHINELMRASEGWSICDTDFISIVTPDCEHCQGEAVTQAQQCALRCERAVCGKDTDPEFLADPKVYYDRTNDCGAWASTLANLDELPTCDGFVNIVRRQCISFGDWYAKIGAVFPTLQAVLVAILVTVFSVGAGCKGMAALIQSEIADDDTTEQLTNRIKAIEQRVGMDADGTAAA